MSINLLITAHRVVKVVKSDKTTRQCISFNTWQTPTSVTYDIINSPNPIEAYKNWIRTKSDKMDIDKSIFDKNDHLYHIELFDEWLNMCDEEDYTVEFEMI